MKRSAILNAGFDDPITITALTNIDCTSTANQEQFLPRYEVVWVQQGQCAIQVNGHPMQVSANSACFLIPGQSSVFVDATTVRGYHISISEEYFRLATSGLPVVHQINFLDKPHCCKPDQPTSAVLEFIMGVIQRDCIEKEDVARGIVLEWLKMMIAYFHKGESYPHVDVSRSRAYEISSNFFQLLAKQFTSQKKVSYYAGSLAISPIHLNQVVKNISGYPASHHIKKCVIVEAKRQAIFREKSMKEIASSLGFEDVAHFSKFFKKNSGVNFSNYRNLETGATAIQ